MALISERFIRFQFRQRILDARKQLSPDTDLMRATPKDARSKLDNERAYKKKARVAGKTAQDFYEAADGAGLLEFYKKYL